MPSSRATERSERSAPSVARCRPGDPLEVLDRLGPGSGPGACAPCRHGPSVTQKCEQCSCFSRLSEQCSQTRALLTSKERVMDTHLVVGAGPVGTATTRRLLEAGHQVRVVTRSGSGPDGSERVAADAGGRHPAGRARRGHGGDLQLREPHLLPVGAGLAARRCRAARRRRVERRRARDGGQPLRLRAGRRADDRADPAGRDRPQGQGAQRDVAAMPSPLTRPDGSAPSRCGGATTSGATRCCRSW